MSKDLLLTKERALAFVRLHTTEYNEYDGCIAARMDCGLYMPNWPNAQGLYSLEGLMITLDYEYERNIYLCAEPSIALEPLVEPAKRTWRDTLWQIATGISMFFLIPQL